MTCSLYFVELAVADLTRSIAWYRDMLGLELQRQDEARGWALFTAGPGRIAIKAGEAQPSSTLLAFEVDDLASWVERLRDRGVELEGEVTASTEGYRRVRLRDPDGHALLLFAW